LPYSSLPLDLVEAVLIWLDMANSPHPMLLGPLGTEFEQAGHELWVTVRDHAQTVDLARDHWPDAKIVGGASPSSRPGKAWVLGRRVQVLHSLAKARKPDVAVSLNSYAQVVAARMAGVPSVTLMDYEFQPANHLSFRLAQAILLPTAIPDARIRRFGMRSKRHILWFHGYKEELYLDRVVGSGADGWSSFSGAADNVRCLFRPPPEGAMYHREGNAHFDELLVQAARRGDTNVLVLPRFPEQRAAFASMPGVTVTDHTVDGLRTLRSADVFVGAGGTMCREAALLGVPAYTVFAGRLAAVDQQLISEGRLHDLRESEVDVTAWVRRDPGESHHSERLLELRARTLRSWLVAVTEAVAVRNRRP
jgi:uncharacterized protein